jgi:hypothetical protein
MEIVAFLTKSQEGATLMKQGNRKGNSMRGLPDSAILGTYGRIKHRKNKHRSRANDGTVDFLNDYIERLMKKQADKKQDKLTKV